LAIYHFTVTVISRARGQRIVALAAASAAAKLRDEYYGALHNHEHREAVAFSEIAAPAGAPSWVSDREKLWNRVEAAERRRDSQLARAVEISLPVELDLEQCVGLLREFVHAEFVAKRMIADMSIRRTKLGNPNARVLLTLREAGAAGFGPKMRQWNRKNNLMSWRESWARYANLHLARAGHRVRIDHRTLDQQQIVLTPARRTGIGYVAAGRGSLPEYLRDRFEQQRRIAADNGSAIVQDPAIAIRALANQRHYFSAADLGRFLESRTDGQAQLAAALSSIMASAELVPVELHGGTLYTSRDLMDAEKSLLRRAQNLTRRGDLRAVAVSVGQLHDFLLELRSDCTQQGKRLREATPVPQEVLATSDVLLLQDAEMLGLKTLEKHLDAVERARATVVLVADAERLQAMGAMSPMHELIAPIRAAIHTAVDSPLVP
jgi:ATP-dependent exoDNAse (exonuclease V) alpha subunit